jgi:putative spermidine/putrescine transport system permease protein
VAQQIGEAQRPGFAAVRRAPMTLTWAWLGIAPFIAFAFAFLILPSGGLFVGSFLDDHGHFTLSNIMGLGQAFVLNAYWLSIKVSLVTALGGGILGFMLSYAVILGGLPRFLRTGLMTFSGVASNFAGVPLAFAFIATLGRTGMVTAVLRSVFHLDIYSAGFNLYSFWGLSLTYMYFQFPLMVLIIAPALDGLRHEWREAAENLGASSADYWRYVAFPILAPSLLGTMLLLFGNSFGAYATAFSLTGGSLNLAPIVIGAEIRGEVLHDPGLGYALALGMVVVMCACIALYTWLQGMTARRLR